MKERVYVSHYRHSVNGNLIYHGVYEIVLMFNPTFQRMTLDEAKRYIDTGNSYGDMIVSAIPTGVFDTLGAEFLVWPKAVSLRIDGAWVGAGA